jgi:group I intron endonuclease
MTCGIYCIENVVNGKKYIGQSINIEVRWKTHGLNTGKGGCTALQNAWNEYGSENFRFYVLHECGQDDLDKMEIYYIELEKTTLPEYGYNIKRGGSGTITENKKTAYKNMIGRKKSNGRSKYVGIYFDGKTNRWISDVKVDKKRKHIGTFLTEISAAKAYNDYVISNGILNVAPNIITEEELIEDSKACENIKLRLGIPKYKGVCYDKKSDLWHTRITVDNQRISLGYYATEDDAAFVYNVAAINEFSDKAILNDIPSNITQETVIENLRVRMVEKRSSRSDKPTSMYFGVYYDSSRGKWGATLKNIHIGRFDTEVDAALAYNAKFEELFGDLAILNVIS